MRTADFLADLASISGWVQFVERAVRTEEVGRSIDDLATGGRGLRIYRGGRPIGFREKGANKRAPGDTMVDTAVEIAHTP